MNKYTIMNDTDFYINSTLQMIGGLKEMDQEFLFEKPLCDEIYKALTALYAIEKILRDKEEK